MQEFETGMMKLWGITPQTKGRKRYLNMLRSWFSTIDVDGSGEIGFDEFQAWYTKSVADAHEAGVL
jgi:Ca2+-binding EF-hand superfamily protein